jgi:hypothetical protein
MTTNVDVLAVMHSALGDLMAAEVGGFDTETNVRDLSASIDAVADLIKAAQTAHTSIQHMRGPESIIHARTAELDSALARVKGA